ncbi:MAG: phosphate signaling complex protein PhoU [Chitinivibrionales bacterium]|nr:phosphate signaling complex protein PhoU [Chitinivibrionales bacterium]
MTVLMMREFSKLKKAIFSLSALVEESVNRSVRAVTEKSVDLARKVIESDREIDQMEVEVEEECLKILALHQPVASDLRYIVSVLKMNNDLERMGDLAVGISKNAEHIANLKIARMPFDMRPMAEKVRSMLKNSLDALVNLDVELARTVLATDKQVDRLYHEMYDHAVECRHDKDEEIDCMLRLLSIARNLERIGDHATNVAEDVIYLVEGEIVRHNPQETSARKAPAASA